MGAPGSQRGVEGAHALPCCGSLHAWEHPAHNEEWKGLMPCPVMASFMHGSARLTTRSGRGSCLALSRVCSCRTLHVRCRGSCCTCDASLARVHRAYPSAFDSISVVQPLWMGTQGRVALLILQAAHRHHAPVHPLHIPRMLPCTHTCTVHALPAPAPSQNALQAAGLLPRRQTNSSRCPTRPWVRCRRSWAGSRTGRAFGDRRATDRASGDGRATGRATRASDRRQGTRARLATC
eukprot:364606-Chlamydomonas_euryale.AAC.7